MSAVVTETGRGDEQAQDGDVVMPFYILADTSGSMSRDVAALTEGLRGLQQLIRDNPEVADVVQVAILEFNSTCRALVPLGRLEDATVPALSAGGGTDYVTAFRTLRGTVDADIARLKQTGGQVYRSCVFFLTDGEPNPGAWEAEFSAQFGFDPETGAGNRSYPRFIPFGFRDARLETLARLAYPKRDGKAFVQSSGASVKDAFDAILPYIGKTIMKTGLTGLASTSAAPQHVLPESLPGFAEADSQYAGGDWM
jgi:uncharacterized protein YegL